MGIRGGVAGIGRVQSRGQVTIPQEIREACGVEPGRDVFFVQTGPDTFECHVLPARRSVLEIIAEHAGEGPAPSMEEIREYIADEIARKYNLDEANDVPA